MVLCAAEFWARRPVDAALSPPIAGRYAAVVAIAWTMAIALWPWLQTGNPWAQFKVALLHFATIPMSYDFSHWGERIATDALPRSYIPGQLLARLPEAFLVLLAVAFISTTRDVVVLALETYKGKMAGPPQRKFARGSADSGAWARVPYRMRGLNPSPCVSDHTTRDHLQRNKTRNVRRPHARGDRWRGIADAAPANASGSGSRRHCGGRLCRRNRLTLAVLHPLEYVAMNSLAGGTQGAYDRFELDYWSVAATEACVVLSTESTTIPLFASPTAPNILICIPWREERVDPLLKRPWIVQTDPDKADFIIATELSRCAENKPFDLIDEVKRFDRTFAWVYVRRAGADYP
jgi:hypothetical protein